MAKRSRQYELLELCRKWQEKLRLQDWKISIKFVNELPESVLAHCDWVPEDMSATVEVLRPERDGLLWADTPLEQIVIHELLHICLEGHKPLAGKYDHQYECAINKIARAYLGKV